MEDVKKHFHEDDIPWIQGIPIDLYVEDTLTWPYTPNGQYIVKSGYRIGREINIHPTRCSNMEDIHKWWKMLWSMHLPPRMKLFGWQVCHNWLPAKTNLYHRGMNVNPSCDLCGNQAETLTHALWCCAKVKPIWKLVPWYKRCEHVNKGSMFDILVTSKEQLDKSEFEDAIKIMWAIWENRNRNWNKLPVMNGIQLLEWILSAYPGSNSIDENAMKPTLKPQHLKQWKRPPTGCISVNCDAAMHTGAAGVGTGFIWRDWEGKIMLADGRGLGHSGSTQKQPYTTTSPIEIQSDCKQLVDAIKDQDNHLSAVNTILHQIKFQMKSSNCNNIVHIINVLKGDLNDVKLKALGDDCWKLSEETDYGGWAEIEQGTSLLTLRDLILQFHEYELSFLKDSFTWDEANKEEKEVSKMTTQLETYDAKIDEVLTFSSFTENEFMSFIFDEFRYSIPLDLVPVFKNLLHKHGDIGSRSGYSKAFKSVCYFLICKVMREMHTTLVIDITKDLLQYWYHHIKFVAIHTIFELGFVKASLEEITRDFFYLQLKQTLEIDIPTIMKKRIAHIQKKMAHIEKKMAEYEKFCESTSKMKFMNEGFNKVEQLKWKRAGQYARRSYNDLVVDALVEWSYVLLLRPLFESKTYM
ncbi:hypothetical protein F8388_019090 [Cannabis sativa]|uniref:Reverse transcriptase zinc-binding domain-containing protein n=1 Tax=Cannabis sativa TaxID=3483 RepID=A0A7J6FCF3_CANSA|nr:hypothetical protein F8388_019090 [Cannabis sativa]